MVEQYALPQNGTVYRTERGCTAIWVPCPTMLVLALKGHGEGAFAAPIGQAFETLSRSEQLCLFLDCEALGNYDSQLRTELTSRFLPERGRIKAFDVLVKSRFVSMGVTVMNLALGGILHSSTERASFVAALDACLYEQRVVGFSSRALELVRFGNIEAHA